MEYEFGASGNLHIKSGWAFSELDASQNEENIQLLCHAVHQLQADCSNSVDRNFNRNGVWYLEKIEGTELDNWNLHYEGQGVFSLQQGRDCDYIVKYLDNSNIQEWLSPFCSYAKQHAERFGRR